jgi:hypothetical protein
MQVAIKIAIKSGIEQCPNVRFVALLAKLAKLLLKEPRSSPVGDARLMVKKSKNPKEVLQENHHLEPEVLHRQIEAFIDRADDHRDLQNEKKCSWKIMEK